MEDGNLEYGKGFVDVLSDKGSNCRSHAQKQRVIQARSHQK